jgi:acetyl-CoA C-acetyltransferase
VTVDDIAIIGAGLHPWGKFPEKFWTNMASDAINDALKDAGITWKDIEIVAKASTPARTSTRSWATPASPP